MTEPPRPTKRKKYPSCTQEARAELAALRTRAEKAEIAFALQSWRSSRSHPLSQETCIQASARFRYGGKNRP